MNRIVQILPIGPIIVAGAYAVWQAANNNLHAGLAKTGVFVGGYMCGYLGMALIFKLVRAYRARRAAKANAAESLITKEA